MRRIYFIWLFMFLCFAPQKLVADVPADHGLDDLVIRIGVENIPTGSGVEVGQVEASDTGGNYAPDENDKAFPQKTFVLQSGTSEIYNHATQVGKRIYGNHNVGIAPGVNLINVYDAEGFLLADYLRSGTSSHPKTPPGDLQLFNNSWIGTFGNSAFDNEVLRRTDWAIDTHNVTFLNGVANSGSASPLLGYSFNCISVGKANGEHVYGQIPEGYDVPGRQIPLIVASQNTTSNSTGVVSAATALLIEIQRTHPNTADNFFATLSETTKAVLLAGARHGNDWTNNPITSGANRGKTFQPIDEVVGVGTVNIDRSHLIMTGGQHEALSSLTSLPIAPFAGWDTGVLSPGQSKYIRFSVATLAEEVVILTTWHQKPNSDFQSYKLVNIDLKLWSLNGEELQSLVGNSGLGIFSSGNITSESDVDNVEHLYIKGLAPGEYALEIDRIDTNSGSRVYSVGWLFPESEAVPGDLDGDGVVGIEDLLIVISGWGSCSNCVADINKDGVVDVEDLLLVISYWQ